jgi:DNA-binding NarL/FixJ family response regulator
MPLVDKINILDMESPVIKIALAEDNGFFRKALSDYFLKLSTVNFLFAAKDGSELLEQIKNQKEIPDIIFMDYKMPIMDGRQTTIAVKKKYSSSKVIMLSLFCRDYIISSMIAAGATGYLSKNVELETLEKAINVVMTGKYFIETGHGIFETFTSRTKNNNYNSAPLEITAKQKQFIQLCSSELSYKEIADKMGISIKTVDNYRDMIFKRFNVTTRIGLVIFSAQNGITDIIE